MNLPNDPTALESLKSTPVGRRTVFAGAAGVGALAAAAAALPLGKTAAPVEAVAKAVDAEGGYRLTEHVQRYYQTARV